MIMIFLSLCIQRLVFACVTEHDYDIPEPVYTMFNVMFIGSGKLSSLFISQPPNFAVQLGDAVQLSLCTSRV